MLARVWRTNRWLVIPGLGALGVLLWVLWLWLGSEARPRYQGFGLRYWYPNWVIPALQGDSLHARQLSLGTAGPEALPLLVAAVGEGLEPGRGQRVSAALDRLPHPVRRWLPSWEGSGASASAFFQWLGQRDNLRALVEARPALSEPVMAMVCTRLGQLKEMGEITLPYLESELASTNTGLAAAAGVAMLEILSDGDSRVTAVIERLSRLPDTSFEGSGNEWWFRLTVRCMTLTGHAGDLEAWMKRWFDRPRPSRLPICAALVMSTVDPEGYPASRVIGELLDREGLAGVQWLLHFTGRAGVERHPREREIAELLTRYLAPDAGSVGGRRDPRRLAALRWLRGATTNAAPALPRLLPLVLADEPEVARLAAECIAGVGPVAVETIPELVPGLTNGPTAPSLVLLMAAYGAAARVARPVLERMAEGEMVLGGDVDRLGMSPEIARRYGLTMTARYSGEASRRIHVPPSLAFSLGLTEFWPLPAELRGKTNLWWGLVHDKLVRHPPVPDSRGRPRVRMATLAELAAEAVRRIDGDTTER